MAHRIIGLDVGRDAVRAVELELTFREAKVTQTLERPVPGGETAEAPARAREVAAALAAERGWGAETVMVAADDEHVAVRALQFPFTEAGKIEKALPFQLEGTTPYTLDDMVRDHRMVERGDRAGAGAGGAPGARVLVALARRAHVESALAGWRGAAIEPRGVLLGPATLGAVVRRVLGEGHRPVAVVEVAETWSTVALVTDGRVRSVRVIARGLAQVEHEIERAFGCTPEEAAAVLRHQGEALAPTAPLRGGDRGKMDAAVRRGLAPLGIEVKRTLLAERSAGSEGLAEVLLCGTGASLRGAAHWLEGMTGVPARVLEGPALPGGAAFARALGLALSGAPGASREVPDLRRGDLAFKGSQSFVRDALVRIAAIAAVLTLLWAGSVWARLRVFDAEEAALTARLSALTKRVTGREIADLDAARREIVAGGAASDNPLPEATAYDILREMSMRIPRDVVVDIKELDIKPKKTFMKGVIDKAGDEDRIVTVLKEFSTCFTEFKPGEVRPTIDKKRKEFSLNITAACP